MIEIYYPKYKKTYNLLDDIEKRNKEIERLKKEAEEIFKDCNHVFIPRKRTLKDGRNVSMMQCVICGINGSMVSKKEHPPIGDFDEDAHKNFVSVESKRYEYVRENQPNIFNNQNEEKMNFVTWYSQYLESDIWKRKRQRVLERACGICESCMEEEAVHVHHLTYDRVGREPLFDLVAVCDTCHRQIHKLDDNDELLEELLNGEKE
jgi:5-methylcytosine-specific restriction endonuclease McrA